MNPRWRALVWALVANLVPVAGCGPSMSTAARKHFAANYGCEDVTEVRERPDLVPAGAGPTYTHSGQRVYEVTGCGHHDLETCDTPGYQGNTLIRGQCSAKPM
jgi:hypothetical protein